MNVLLSWLSDFVAFNLEVPEVVELLTRAGIKVERVMNFGVDVEKVVVARIDSSRQHPNADRLSVCMVDDGSGSPRQIVCGAKNYKPGDLVPLALPGALLHGGLKIKAGKLRGESSEGMLCSRSELGVPGDASGLWILPGGMSPGTPLRDALPGGTAIELEITPNRADWLSHLGVAREISAFLNLPLKWTAPAGVIEATNPSVARIETGAECPFYSLRRIRGVKVGPSPSWLIERLEHVGLRPINNIVDATNYVMMELGQPLHAFDAEKVRGAVRARAAVEGEEMAALDGSRLTLAASDTVIADDAGAIALAGVIGGLESAVADGTTCVLLESALFTPSAIRRTARRTGISTDSSYRFERGVDSGMVLAASARACELIVELAGGEADAEVFVSGGLPAVCPPVTLRHERCNRLLGTMLDDGEIRSCLTRAGFQEISFDGNRSEWVPPSFRREAHREVDLVEEVARLIGIQRIPSRVVSFVSPATRADREYDFLASLRQKLVASGFFEARLSTLVAGTHLGENVSTSLRLKNPLGEEQSWLRPSLLPGLLDCARRNFHAGAGGVFLFEAGSVFSSEGVEQRPALALVASGPRAAAHWLCPHPSPVDFFEFVGIIETLLPPGVHRRNAPGDGFAIRAEFFHGERLLGWAGILLPTESRRLDATDMVCAGQLFPSEIFEILCEEEREGIVPLPKYPAVTRDLAVVVDASVPYSAIEAAIRSAELGELIDVRPFDVFRDKEGIRLAIDKKSVAVSLTFQSPGRTLEGSEIDAAIGRIREAVTRETGATFRE